MKRVPVTIVAKEKQELFRIRYSECLRFWIHFIQHAKRICPIVLSSASPPAVEKIFQIDSETERPS